MRGPDATRTVDDFFDSLEQRAHEMIWSHGVRVTLDWTKPLDELRAGYDEAGRLVRLTAKVRHPNPPRLTGRGAVLGRDPLDMD